MDIERKKETVEHKDKLNVILLPVHPPSHSVSIKVTLHFVALFPGRVDSKNNTADRLVLIVSRRG